jgi:hypothetical protein
LTLLAKSCKVNENSVTAKNPVAATSGADRDNTTYTVGGIYAWQAGQAGVLYKFYNYAGNKATQVAPGVYLDQNAMNFHLVSPYIIAQFGPVKVNFDFYYFWGKYISTTVAPIGEKDMQSINAQLDATATFGPIYFGGNVTYISGDDPGTSDKLEGGVGGGGADWSPCLIMWNFDRTYWAGSLAGQGTSFNANAVGSGSTATYPGAWFFQGRFGVKPTAKLDFMASASYAFADKKPTGYASDVYGWEFDITGTYKITNNLSYMLGFGYMMTGDFYKGATTGTSVRDDYLVINKLTLTF